MHFPDVLVILLLYNFIISSTQNSSHLFLCSCIILPTQNSSLSVLTPVGRTNWSIYSAELRALLLALELIEGSIKKQFIIFSLSAMQALKKPHPDHPLVGEILSWLTNITVHLELRIFFCWVPGFPCSLPGMPIWHSW